MLISEMDHLVMNPSSCVALWRKLQLLEEVLGRARETSYETAGEGGLE
jgi:hypothetical protein